MKTEPGELAASRITTLPGGTIAQVVLNERTEAFARWYGAGVWSDWWPVADGVRDISVCADIGQPDLAVLVNVVAHVPLPIGAFRVTHTVYQSAFYRLTADGVSSVDL
jgi:hypothetical protein